MEINNLIGKEVMFGNDMKMYIGDITEDNKNIVLNIKKGTKFGVIFDEQNSVRLRHDDLIFSYDWQWVTFDQEELNSDTWEEGLSLLLIVC